MQQFQPPEEETQTASAPPPSGVEAPEQSLEGLATQGKQVSRPLRDTRGRTLDDALLEDRGVRERILRRARKVMGGMQFCRASQSTGLRIVKGSWVPFQKAIHSVAPKSGEQVLFSLMCLCCCGVPLFYIGAGLLAIGVAGTVLGCSLWAMAAVTHAVLDLYLRHLIPW